MRYGKIKISPLLPVDLLENVGRCPDLRPQNGGTLPHPGLETSLSCGGRGEAAPRDKGKVGGQVVAAAFPVCVCPEQL